jgi:hypothetical protein
MLWKTVQETMFAMNAVHTLIQPMTEPVAPTNVIPTKKCSSQDPVKLAEMAITSALTEEIACTENPLQSLVLTDNTRPVTPVANVNHIQDQPMIEHVALTNVELIKWFLKMDIAKFAQ